MNATKVSNNLFTYEIIGFAVYLAYHSKTGILRTISKEDGSIVDEREMEFGMDFEDFCEMMKLMHLDLAEAGGEGNPAMDTNIYSEN